MDVEALAAEWYMTISLMASHEAKRAAIANLLTQFRTVVLEEAAKAADAIHADNAPPMYSAPSWEEPYAQGAKACAAAIRALYNEKQNVG